MDLKANGNGGRPAAFRQEGLEGKVWARGYDKRFCFEEVSVESRIAYVVKHEENDIG